MRRILHVDMDAFYASVEQRDDPSLRGKPVAVGGSPDGRGVVCAASYEARPFGVRSAIPMSRAVRLCPDLVIVPPDFGSYRCRLVRSLSAVPRGHAAGGAAVAGRGLPRRHRECVGRDVGPPRRGAAEDVHPRDDRADGVGQELPRTSSSRRSRQAGRKPDGLTVIAPERVEKFLQGLPIDALWGVGPVTAARLRAQGIDRLVDVRTMPTDELKTIVGSLAAWLKQLADGVDDRPVEPNRDAKSASSENTFDKDLTDAVEIRRAVDEMARGVVEVARKEGSRRPHGHAESALLGLHHHHAQPDAATPTAGRGDDRRAAVALLERTEAGAPAGATARRRRPQLLATWGRATGEDGAAPERGAAAAVRLTSDYRLRTPDFRWRG